MKYSYSLLIRYFILLFFILLVSGCVAKFVPEISEDKELLVVQGLITNQAETDTIRLSKSLPLGKISTATPVSGCSVSISDDQGSITGFSETAAGTYISPSSFLGVIGRSYTLHITTNASSGSISYESYPMEMISVPPIDSIYYEKTVIEAAYENFQGVDGCQIYLNTHDPDNKCKYYRWDFSETWKLRLLFPVENMICWISDKSSTINIKNTVALNEAKIDRFPINYITNITDRLKVKYSILVNQYSLNEDEYDYWEKVQNMITQVGGLYDIIPASIPSNIQCIDNPEEKVLGYFSVSAKSSKRIFIKDNFSGIIDQYADCISDTVLGEAEIPGLNVSVWTLIDIAAATPNPRFRVFTEDKGCADCTVRGSNKEPDFWEDDKKDYQRKHSK
jgi:hypothetical protein